MTRERWMALCFALGSTCFLVGPFPGYVNLVGSTVTGLTFFVGSILFTAGGGLQTWLAAPERQVDGAGRAAWWAAVIQSAGTLFFNVTTFTALSTLPSQPDYDRLVWRPDALGSVCFLVSGYLAYAEVCGHPFWTRNRTLEWKIAAVNLVGCVAFGISAIAAFWVPSSGDVLALAASNWTTALGGLCFLIGAVLLLPESAATETLESGGAALYAQS